MRRFLLGVVGLAAIGGLARRRPDTLGKLKERAPVPPRALRTVTGRLPQIRSASGLSGKTALEQYLRQAGVPYQIEHHPAAYTAQEVAEAEHVSGDRVAKVVMIACDDAPAMLVLPASRRVDFERLYEALGTTAVRLLDEAEFGHLFPGSELGAEPAFGNRFGLPVYLEESLAAEPRLISAAGTHTDTVSLATADYLRLVEPTLAAFAAAPSEVAESAP